MPAATVIVPTARAGERLRRLLASLEGEAETIVVDNASGDPELGELEQRFDGLRVLTMVENTGFGRAVNAAARQATADVLVLVNDDCVCDPGFVAALASRIDPKAGVTMAAGVLREAADPSLIDSAGVELDRSLLGFDYLNGTPVSALDRATPDPLGPTGGAAAYDRETFLTLGGFDEAFFAYWEDVDLALRMRLAGGRCALAIDALATHEHSGTAGSGSVAKNRMMGFGRGYLLRKYGAGVRRLPGVLARDGVILAGQLVTDRNLAGVRGRVAGWMKGRREFEYPGGLIESLGPPGLRETLKRRARRRKRLRGAGADQDRPGRPDVDRNQGSLTKRPYTGRNVRNPPVDGGAEADPRPKRALAVFHVAELSGPALSLESRLRWLAETARLDVIVPGDGATADLYRQFATVHTLPYEALTLPRSPLSVLSLARRTRRDVANFKTKLHELNSELVVVSTATLPAVQIAARRERIPVALEASELLTSGRAAPRRAAGRALVRSAARRANVVFACSEAVAAEYSGAAAPVLTSYPPIADRYGGGDGPAFRREHGIPADAQLVLAVGSITERRGQDVLIDALTLVNGSRGARPAFLAIAGEPFPRPPDLEFERRLRARADGAGDTIRLVGFQADPADAYAAADVVVNPRRDPEAFGRVPCEALLAGCAVVVARTGAVAEVLRDGETALLVAPGDVAATAAAIETLLGDPGLSAGMAARGRADVLERFSDEAAIATFARGLRRVDTPAG